MPANKRCDPAQRRRVFSGMKMASLGIVLIALPLAGCAESSPATDDHPSSAISVPVGTNDSSNPPPTLSGYVDSSYTLQK